MNNNKRLEWMLHEYFEALERKRTPVLIANPTEGLIRDGGTARNVFCSSIPRGVEFTDMSKLIVIAQVDSAMLQLKRFKKQWYACVFASHELINGARRSPGDCVELLGLKTRTYQHYNKQGKNWLEGRLNGRANAG